MRFKLDISVVQQVHFELCLFEKSQQNVKTRGVLLRPTTIDPFILIMNFQLPRPPINNSKQQNCISSLIEQNRYDKVRILLEKLVFM